MNKQVQLASQIFIKNFKWALSRKHVLLCRAWVDFSGSKVFINLEVFFQYKRIQIYSRKVKCFKNKKFKTSLFYKQEFKFFKTSLHHTRIYNLNKNINRKRVRGFLGSFRRFRNVLFIRRRGLFSDFINVSSLLADGKIKVGAYLTLLSEIFTVVLKNKHTQFFLMVSTVFNYILNQKTGLIKGLKFILNGKLKGKPRTSTFRALFGKVPCQEITSKVEFSKVNTYNRYGAYGFKLWTNY